MFNVGGISYGSLVPFLEAYRSVHVGWLWCLWISVLIFSVSTVLLVGQRTWEKVAHDRSDLEKRLQPKCEFYFSPSCCLRRRVNCVFIGVRNFSALTIQNILIRIDIPDVGTRGNLLPWSGHEVGEPIQIDPSPPKFHHHFVLAERIEIQGRYKLRMAHHDFDRIHLGAGEYKIKLSATGAGVTPAVARAMLSLSQDGAMTLKPLPDFGMEGWAPREA